MLRELISPYIVVFNFYSGIYLAGSFIIAMTTFFKTDWSQGLKDLIPLWKKLSLFWGILFIPMIFLIPLLYPWESFHGHKGIYFASWFVSLRIFFYLLSTWWGMKIIHKRPTSTMIISLVVGTLFSMDYSMSLEGEWSSNIYGLMFLLNSTFGFFAITILLKFKISNDLVKKDMTHLLLAFAVIWGYIHYSQFLIFWMGNKPKEVIFYWERLQEHYLILTASTLIIKFLPIFVISFFPKLKIQSKVMLPISALIVLGTLTENLWFVGPPLKLAIISTLLMALVMTFALGIPLWSKTRKLQ